MQGAPVRNHREFARVLREAFRDQLWDSMVTTRSKNADVAAGQGVEGFVEIDAALDPEHAMRMLQDITWGEDEVVVDVKWATARKPKNWDANANEARAAEAVLQWHPREDAHPLLVWNHQMAEADLVTVNEPRADWSAMSIGTTVFDVPRAAIYAYEDIPDVSSFVLGSTRLEEPRIPGPTHEDRVRNYQSNRSRLSAGDRETTMRLTREAARAYNEDCLIFPQNSVGGSRMRRMSISVERTLDAAQVLANPGTFEGRVSTATEFVPRNIRGDLFAGCAVGDEVLMLKDPVCFDGDGADEFGFEKSWNLRNWYVWSDVCRRSISMRGYIPLASLISEEDRCKWVNEGGRDSGPPVWDY